MSALWTAYRHYLALPDHPMKGRVTSLLDRHFFRSARPVLTAQGIWMNLHPSRPWEAHLIKGGAYQAAMCRFMTENLRRGDTAVIGGVSFGQQTIIASQITGTSGRVIAVEPAPAALNSAAANIRLNDLPENITLIAAAIGDSETLVPIASGVSGHVGEGSLLKDAGRIPFHIQVRTLPSLIDELGFKNIDALFLDVIGYERQILAPLARFPSLRPRFITLVAHPWVEERAGGLDDLVGRLNALGYECRSLTGVIPKSLGDLRECQLIAATPNTSIKWIPEDHDIKNGIWM